MSDVLADVLARRRDRAIAAILGVKEREADPHLPRPARDALRKVVLDQLNDYHGMVLDVLCSVADYQREHGVTVVPNELYFEKLLDIHAAVVGNGHSPGP